MKMDKGLKKEKNQFWQQQLVTRKGLEQRKEFSTSVVKALVGEIAVPFTE